MDGWTDGQTDERLTKETDRQTEGRKDRWRDGQTYRQMDRQTNQADDTDIFRRNEKRVLMSIYFQIFKLFSTVLNGENEQKDD